MTELEAAQRVLDQDGSCDCVHCEECPAFGIHHDICGKLWRDHAQKKQWFKNWLDEHEPKKEEAKVEQEKEYEVVKFNTELIDGKKYICLRCKKIRTCTFQNGIRMAVCQPCFSEIETEPDCVSLEDALKLGWIREKRGVEGLNKE